MKYNQDSRPIRELGFYLIIIREECYYPKDTLSMEHFTHKGTIFSFLIQSIMNTKTLKCMKEIWILVTSFLIDFIFHSNFYFCGVWSTIFHAKYFSQKQILSRWKWEIVHSCGKWFLGLRKFTKRGPQEWN